jgi:hypothetical protein
MYGIDLIKAKQISKQKTLLEWISGCTRHGYSLTIVAVGFGIGIAGFCKLLP